MARPPKEITEKNARKVVRYLVRLMKDVGRRVFAGDYEAGGPGGAIGLPL